jgi:hypothetical protein
MTDELVNKGQHDRSHICISRKTERRFWSRHLRITEAALQEVIGKVGNSAAAVGTDRGSPKLTSAYRQQSHRLHIIVQNVLLTTAVPFDGDASQFVQ